MIETILMVLLAVIVLPVLAYMIVKFGAAGYFRARDKHKQQKDQNEQER